MASVCSFIGFLLFSPLSDCELLHRPVVLSDDVGYKGSSGAQVPPVFPSGGVSVSPLPAGDWSGGLSVI